jgi:uncharacterized protein (TIGR02246 family)
MEKMPMAAEQIKGLFDKWNDALQTRDPQQVVSLYADDAVLLPTVSNQVRHNHGEIENYFQSFLKKSPKGKVTESNVREYGDVALHSGVYVFNLTDGDTSSEVPCRFTFVYRKDGDDWKIIEHHSSMMPE